MIGKIVEQAWNTTVEQLNQHLMVQGEDVVPNGHSLISGKMLGKNFGQKAGKATRHLWSLHFIFSITPDPLRPTRL